MNRFYLPLVTSLWLLSLPSASIASPQGMNWKNGEVSASGVGVAPERIKQAAQARAMACRAAKLDALRNLLEVVQGVRIDSMSLVKDAMLESDMIRTTVKGIVKGARVTDQQAMADGSCEVTMVMPVAGDLFSAVISEDAFRKKTAGSILGSLDFAERMQQLVTFFTGYGFIASAHASSVPIVTLENESQADLARKLKILFEGQGDKVAALLMHRAIARYQKGHEVTGIVIDASNVTSFHPAALPWIRDSKGKKLYPNADTPYEIVRSNMPVSYDFDVSSAVQNKRVATTPVILKAVSTYKKRRSDLILDEEGKRKFLSMLRKGNVNKNARIMIVIND